MLDRLHVLVYLGNEVHLTGTHRFDQPVDDVTLIGIHPAKQLVTQEGHRFAVIDVAWRDFDAQQFAMVIAGCVQLEPIELASRTLVACSDPDKDPVARNAQVVVYRKRAGIENGNARTTRQIHASSPTARSCRVWMARQGVYSAPKPGRSSVFGTGNDGQRAGLRSARLVGQYRVLRSLARPSSTGCRRRVGSGD
jgi:hypothetical protein